MPKSPRLRRILLAYAINELGTWFAYVALSIVVYNETHSAPAVAVMFVSARLVPALTVSALVARAEAWQRRGQLTALYLIEAITITALLYVFHHFWLPAVLIIVLIDGAAALTAAALLRAAAATVAGKDAEGASTEPFVVASDGLADDGSPIELSRRRANAALNIAYTASVAIGPALAGIVIGAGGVSTALLIDIGSFLVCGALLFDLRTHVEEAGASVRARLRTALEHLRAIPSLRNLLILEAITLIFFASVEPIEVIYAKQTLQAGDSGFGLLIGAWGAGMVLGGLAFSRLLHSRLGPMLTFGTLIVGVSYLGSAAAPSLLVACIASIIGGTGNGIQWASLISAVQQLTPDALQGRLMSAVEAIGALCPATGYVLGGVITALSNPRGAFLVAGLIATAATSVFYRTTMRPGALTKLEPNSSTDAYELPSFAGDR